MGKPYHGIHENAVQELLQYDWPGNIRELENVIEQAVIINDRHSPLEWGRPLVNKFALNPPAPREPVYPAHSQTLTDLKQLQQETEREYILTILQKARWRIRGKGGAAELLNMKPTTLESRMQKLGISK
jgi:transcriptional regulator with GAF, ATPase, and Fis domain